MRQPSPIGTSVDQSRKKIWHDRFLNYRYPPSHDAVVSFLKQFDSKHRDVAARLLDAVEVVTRLQMEHAFQTLMQGLPGWHRDKNKRIGEWRFVPYSFSSGESGDEMIHIFRQSMGLGGRYYNELFIHPHNLPSQQLRGTDTVVLVDDFSGSGNQACKSWNELFRELAGGVGTIYLMVVAATMSAKDFIIENTDLQVLCHFQLNHSDNFFAEACKHFSEQDKATILHYCKKHFPKEPYGYEDCGLLFVLHHDCPNNSIPLLHKHDKNKWTPLFSRTRITSK